SQAGRLFFPFLPGDERDFPVEPPVGSVANLADRRGAWRAGLRRQEAGADDCVDEGGLPGARPTDQRDDDFRLPSSTVGQVVEQMLPAGPTALQVVVSRLLDGQSKFAAYRDNPLLHTEKRA